MPGVIDLLQADRMHGITGISSAAQMARNRSQANDSLRAQAKAQQQNATGQAVGAGLMAATSFGGPAGLAVGAGMLLASRLF